MVRQIIQVVGKAKNYGPTAEEQKELQRKEADERLVRETAERVEQERREAEETAEKLARWEEWVSEGRWNFLPCGIGSSSSWIFGHLHGYLVIFKLPEASHQLIPIE